MEGNQQQLDHSLQVMDKLDEASDALKQKLYEKVKVARSQVLNQFPSVLKPRS